MQTRLQRGSKHGAQPFWLRALAVFCIGLLGLASTAQVCHNHFDAFEASVLQGAAASSHAAAALDKQVTDADSSSGVSCPLCVAMHSALPVADSLSQVAMVAMATMAPRADGIDRMFAWRFEMASRPPPVERISA